MHYLIAFLWSLPWIIPPLVTYFRLRHSRSLDDESDIPLENPPLVSVIVPARNEAHNIARCVSSILSATYPNLELIVVDDGSTDGTAEIAREGRVASSPLLQLTAELFRMAHAELGEEADHVEAVRVVERMGGAEIGTREV